MSDENKEVVENVDPVDHNAKFYEDLAIKSGWDPEGEKSAEDFVNFALEKFPKRGAALKKQNTQLETKDNELSQMKVVLDQLANDFNKSKEIAYNQAMADLQAERRQAIANADVERVDQLDAQKEQLEQAKIQAPQQQQQNTAVDHYRQEVINGYLTRNDDWLNGDSDELLEMQGYARQLDTALTAKKLPIQEHVERLEQAVMKKYKNYFNDAPIDNVETNHDNNVMKRNTKKKFTERDLTPAQLSAGKYLADNGITPMDVYIKRLVEQGDLK